MKTDAYVTVQDIIDYVEKYNIPKDIPIGIALCSSERGDVCRGIIVDTPNENCEFDEKEFDYIRDETHGEHCYFKGENPMYELETDKMLMLTDGWHYTYD